MTLLPAPLRPGQADDGARTAQLRTLSREIAEARAHAQQRWVDFEAARDAAGDDGNADAAHEAHTAYEQAADRLQGLESERDRVWLSGRGPGSTAPGADLLDREPGRWLASVIEQHALTTTEAGSTTDLGIPFFDRFVEASALFASRPTIVEIATTSIKIPRLDGRLTASPVVAELDPIPEDDVPLDQVEVKPPKYARLATISEEAYSDARPAVLAANERELIRSIASGFDRQAFHGAAATPQVGLVNTAGVGSIDAVGALANLDIFANAIGMLRAAGTRATAIYLNPLTWQRLSLLKKQTGSNEPLVAGELPASDGPAERIFGVPVFLTEAIDEDTGFVADARDLVVVRRSDVEIAVDRHYKFNLAGVGVRVIARVALVVAQPAGVVVIENLPTT